MSAKSDPQRRMSVRFEGRVQGVGFRYTTVRVATEYDISGFVRNEFDGSVVVVAEGRERDLLDFLASLKSTHLSRYITNESVSWAENRGEFTGFTVRH